MAERQKRRKGKRIAGVTTTSSILSLGKEKMEGSYTLYTIKKKSVVLQVIVKCTSLLRYALKKIPSQ
jgi:hypothetical protein